MSHNEMNDDRMNSPTDAPGLDPGSQAPASDTEGAGGWNEASSRPEDELSRLREALEAKTREAEAHYERYLRGMAEFDNARKRAGRDREDYTRYANESLIRELLPVLDNFERALQAARSDPGAAAVAAGVELIQRELFRVLEKFGVTSFSTVGAPFDPERHEAVARVHDPAHPDLTVVQEQARGYLLNGRVLRPAMVTVAMAADAPTNGPAAS